MANKDYNGASLPDITSVWDKSKYKYALLVHELYTSKDDYRYALFLSDSMAYVDEEDDGEFTMISGGIFEEYLYYPDGDTDGWVWRRENDGDNDFWSFYTEELLWANYDVLNPDGSVYLKGSGATYDKQSFLLGLAMGLSRKGGWG